MTLEEFKQRVTLIRGERAESLRQHYIDCFVNTESRYFQERIATRTMFKDELLYTGYLWDCLKRPERITEEQLLAELRTHGAVYVFWDLQSSEQIHVENYWKFPKESVLQLDARDLEAGFEYLPEDLYIFDDRMDWSLIPTHETDLENAQFFFRAYPDRANASIIASLAES
jgi:hypothetical protein